MQKPSKDMPIAVLCPKCGKQFHAPVGRLDNPGYAGCPRCGHQISLTKNPANKTEPPDFTD